MTAVYGIPHVSELRTIANESVVDVQEDAWKDFLEQLQADVDHFRVTAQTANGYYLKWPAYTKNTEHKHAAKCKTVMDQFSSQGYIANSICGHLHVEWQPKSTLDQVKEILNSVGPVRMLTIVGVTAVISMAGNWLGNLITERLKINQ
jgi:hypothetical protein